MSTCRSRKSSYRKLKKTAISLGQRDNVLIENGQAGKMTNSVKHHQFAAHCGGSNTIWKRLVNRELRRTNKQIIQVGGEPRLIREESNLYDSPQDGSVHFINRAFKKTKQYRPRGLRIKLHDFEAMWQPKVFRK